MAKPYTCAPFMVAATNELRWTARLQNGDCDLTSDVTSQSYKLRGDDCFPVIWSDGSSGSIAGYKYMGEHLSALIKDECGKAYRFYGNSFASHVCEAAISVSDSAVSHATIAFMTEAICLSYLNQDGVPPFAPAPPTPPPSPVPPPSPAPPPPKPPWAPDALAAHFDCRLTQPSLPIFSIASVQLYSVFHSPAVL